MTKQEILKAIENGESVWYLFGEVYELKTSEHTNKFISRSGDYCYTDNNGVDRCAPLDMLYKSRGEAEHYLHHANISRTEYLPFLTWEEFKKKRELKFNSVDCKYCELFIFNGFIYLQVGKDITENSKQQNVGEAIEENFYKAYDECVRLFKQE